MSFEKTATKNLLIVIRVTLQQSSGFVENTLLCLSRTNALLGGWPANSDRVGWTKEKMVDRLRIGISEQ